MSFLKKILLLFIFSANGFSFVSNCKTSKAHRDKMNVFAIGVGKNRELARTNMLKEFNFIVENSDDLKGLAYRIENTIKDSCLNGLCCIGYLYSFSRTMKAKNHITLKGLEKSGKSIPLTSSAKNIWANACVAGIVKYVTKLNRKPNLSLLKKECVIKAPNQLRSTISKAKHGCGAGISMAYGTIHGITKQLEDIGTKIPKLVNILCENF